MTHRYALPLATARRRTRSGARGFTLVEMMFTLFVAAVLLAIGVPAFRDIFVGAKVSTITNDLMGSVQLARSEAIKRNVPITLCRANSDGTDCDTGTDWEGGWIIAVIDPATSTVQQVLQHVETQPENYVVAENAAADLVFQPIGVGATNASFTICRATPVGKDQRVLTITSTGSANVTVPVSPTTCP
jgi:type IV fimbrial biogenesis protein FimT